MDTKLGVCTYKLDIRADHKTVSVFMGTSRTNGAVSVLWQALQVARALGTGKLGLASSVAFFNAEPLPYLLTHSSRATTSQPHDVCPTFRVRSPAVRLQQICHRLRFGRDFARRRALRPFYFTACSGDKRVQTHA